MQTQILTRGGFLFVCLDWSWFGWGGWGSSGAVFVFFFLFLLKFKWSLKNFWVNTESCCYAFIILSGVLFPFQTTFSNRGTEGNVLVKYSLLRSQEQGLEGATKDSPQLTNTQWAVCISYIPVSLESI